jgi:hypothetical protein
VEAVASRAPEEIGVHVNFSAITCAEDGSEASLLVTSSQRTLPIAGLHA